MTRPVVIRNGTVVTVDPELGDLNGADVLIRDGSIADVGHGLDAVGADVIDATDAIVLPGFVDTHRHTWQTLYRGVCGDGVGREYVWAIRAQLATLTTPDDMYVGNYVGALEALNAGVTTLVDYCHNVNSPGHAHEGLRGLRDAGIRAVYAMGFLGAHEYMHKLFADAGGTSPYGESGFADLDERFDFTRAMASEEFSSKDQLVTLGINPAMPQEADSDAIRRHYEAARELDALITQHANPSRSNDRMGDVETLDRAGLMAPDLLLVHCSLNTGDEWRSVAEHGAHVSVCPESEMQMGFGPPAVGRMRELGLDPTLGIDTVVSNSGDMFAAMRLALQTGRMLENEKILRFTPEPFRLEGHNPDTITIRSREALEWATVNGARAAGLERQVGTITPGKRGDIIVLRPGIGLAGWYRRDPVQTVVLQASPANVDTVLVDGRVVKRDGALVGIDVEAAARRIEAAQARLLEQAEQRGGVIPAGPVSLGF